MLEKKFIMGDLWNVDVRYVPREFLAKWDNFCQKPDSATRMHIANIKLTAWSHPQCDISMYHHE